MNAPVNRDEPRTEAGRAIWTTHWQSHGHWLLGWEEAGEKILAIEAEVRAALLAELRAKVEGMRIGSPLHGHQMARGYDTAIDDVLALLSEDPA